MAAQQCENSPPAAERNSNRRDFTTNKAEAHGSNACVRRNSYRVSPATVWCSFKYSLYNDVCWLYSEPRLSTHTSHELKTSENECMYAHALVSMSAVYTPINSTMAHLTLNATNCTLYLSCRYGWTHNTLSNVHVTMTHLSRLKTPIPMCVEMTL